jgi:ribosomal-protein-alanine N-acetyltransferase
MAARANDLDPTALEVHLVPMRRRHLRSVLRIESQVYPRPWSLSLFLSELSLRTSRFYVVARIDAVVVGYAGLMYTGDDAHVTTIAVDPAWHRAKVGSRLLLELAHAALDRGARNLTLEVRVGNAAAQGMYERFGFAPAGIRKNYYVETNEDALVMWAEHIDEPSYRERLDDIERAIPGVTVRGEGLA